MRNIKIEKVNTIKLPTDYALFLLDTYRVLDPIQPQMEYACVIRSKSFLDSKCPLVRVHSKCILSETFNGQLCDCKFQFDYSMRRISKKPGAIIYLNQEGRGHGIFNKVLEIELQEKGYDTVEASKELGLNVDDRNFDVAAKLLKLYQKNSIYLLTNNPDKVSSLKSNGIEVEEVLPVQLTLNRYNKKYLKTKKEKLGHTIKII